MSRVLDRVPASVSSSSSSSVVGGDGTSGGGRLLPPRAGEALSGFVGQGEGGGRRAD